MATKTESTNSMPRWTTDSASMDRLEKLVLLTQRTELLKQLLLIPDEEDRVLKVQIRAILEKHKIAYSPPRGRVLDIRKPKQYSGRARFALAILLGLQVNNQDGGIVLDREGRILSTDVLDRLIFSYYRYLELHKLTTPDPAVNFEFFVKFWRSVHLGEAILTICGNCGSSYGNFRISASHHCPVCASLNLPKLPKKVSDVRVVDFESGLRCKSRFG